MARHVRRHIARSLASLMLCLAVVSAWATPGTIDGITLAKQVPSGAQTLILNGAGVRNKFAIDLYVAALYLPVPSQDAEAIITASNRRRLHLQLLHDIDSVALDHAVREGLANNLDDNAQTALQTSMRRLSEMVQEIGQLKAGDVIELDFTAHGVALILNHIDRGMIPDPALASGLLKIWLGEHPTQDSLKRALLGLS